MARECALPSENTSRRDRLVDDGEHLGEHGKNVDTSSLKRRVHRRKASQYISKRQAANVLEALEFAEIIGCPLNVSVDICWLMFGGTVDDRTRFSRCQQRLSKWAKRQGFALTLIWTREVGKYGSPHTHVLVHVPPWLMENSDFQSTLERSFEPEGGPNHEKAIMIRPAYAPAGKLLYNLKGLDPREATQFGVRASFQGELEGKRVGCTENIGARARKRHLLGK